MANDEHVATLRRRLAELEYEMYINDSVIMANPKNATAGDVEVARWRRAEIDAIHTAIELLADGSPTREIPRWMYAATLAMVALAILLAGMALWMH